MTFVSASCSLAAEAVKRSAINWLRQHYTYVYIHRIDYLLGAIRRAMSGGLEFAPMGETTARAPMARSLPTLEFWYNPAMTSFAAMAGYSITWKPPSVVGTKKVFFQARCPSMVPARIDWWHHMPTRRSGTFESAAI